MASNTATEHRTHTKPTMPQFIEDTIRVEQVVENTIHVTRRRLQHARAHAANTATTFFTAFFTAVFICISSLPSLFTVRRSTSHSSAPTKSNTHECHHHQAASAKNSISCSPPSHRPPSCCEAGRPRGGPSHPPHLLLSVWHRQDQVPTDRRCSSLPAGERPAFGRTTRVTDDTGRGTGWQC